MNDPIAMDTEVRITPVVAGAKNGGLFQIVLGAALIAISLIPAVAAFSAPLAAGMLSAGIGLAVGGVAQLLTKTPSTSASSSADNGTANNYFSSLENVVGQGQPVPLLYGRLRVGSHVISQGINTDITD
jgi:predicted phage tail protein